MHLTKEQLQVRLNTATAPIGNLDPDGVVKRMNQRFAFGEDGLKAAEDALELHEYFESSKAIHHESNNKAQIIIAEQQQRIWELEKALQDRSNG